MKTINVFYFNKKSIHYIDLYNIFDTIFNFFSDCEIVFLEMDSEQKSLNSTEKFGITCIKNLLVIFDGNTRRYDIEEKIIRSSIK